MESDLLDGGTMGVQSCLPESESGQRESWSAYWSQEVETVAYEDQRPKMVDGRELTGAGLNS